MEVLNAVSPVQEFDHDNEGSQSNQPKTGQVEPFPHALEGERLIQTVVSLTDLPEPLIGEEMAHILEASGHSSENLTIEELRASMLAYLEALHQGFED
jgi:predicted aspartyl protease